MLAQLFHRTQNDASDLLASKLFDENTFYEALLKDLSKCQNEVIIESPFVTSRRLSKLIPVIKKLKERKVRIVIITKDPRENENECRREDTADALASLQKIGVHVTYIDGHHRKLAILDRKILYEGSLNILSQNGSREIMRRIDSVQLSWQMARFVGIDAFL